jgi:hypothetical protein
MQKETMEQLQQRMVIARKLLPEGVIRHVKTGGEYMVKGYSLRVSDLELMGNYSPLNTPTVVFSRPISEIQARFVQVNGEDWGDVYNDD